MSGCKSAALRVPTCLDCYPTALPDDPLEVPKRGLPIQYPSLGISAKETLDA